MKFQKVLLPTLTFPNIIRASVTDESEFSLLHYIYVGSNEFKSHEVVFKWSLAIKRLQKGKRRHEY